MAAGYRVANLDLRGHGRDGRAAVGIMLAALRAYDLDGAQAIHAARCLRAAMHGFGVLEAAGAFQRPEGLDESYDRLIHMAISGLRSPWPAVRTKPCQAVSVPGR